MRHFGVRVGTQFESTDLHFCEFGVANARPAKSAPLRAPIYCIVATSAEKDVVWVDALPIVAPMADAEV